MQNSISDFWCFAIYESPLKTRNKNPGLSKYTVGKPNHKIEEKNEVSIHNFEVLQLISIVWNKYINYSIFWFFVILECFI